MVISEKILSYILYLYIIINMYLFMFIVSKDENLSVNHNNKHLIQNNFNIFFKAIYIQIVIYNNA